MTERGSAWQENSATYRVRLWALLWSSLTAALWAMDNGARCSVWSTSFSAVGAGRGSDSLFFCLPLLEKNSL